MQIDLKGYNEAEAVDVGGYVCRLKNKKFFTRYNY